MIEPLLAKFGYVKKETAYASAWKRDLLPERSERVTMPYAQHVWVYRAIRAIATRIAHVPFRLWSGEEEVTDGPLYRLFRDVSPLMSRFQLWEATYGYLLLTGNCMWVLDFPGGDRRGAPRNIFLFNPKRFEPVRDPDSGLPVGWKFRLQSGGHEIFDLDEVVHFKLWNPYDPILGLSPLEAASEGVQLDWNVQRWGRRFFENGAIPGGILFYKGSGLTDEQAQTILDRIEQRHRGTDRAHRTALLQGDFEYREVSFGLQTVREIMEPRRFHREEIAAIYDVPPVVLGEYEHSNFAKDFIQSQIRMLWLDNLIPAMRYAEDVLRTQFFRRLAPEIEGLFDVDAVEALKEDFHQKVETANKLHGMGVPLLEINRLMDLGVDESKVPWGNEWLVPFSLTPARLLLGGEREERRGLSKSAFREKY